MADENLTSPNDDNLFKTHDTALAGYLYSLGYTHTDTDVTQFPAVLVFELSDGLKEAVHNFQLAKAEGNIVLFFRGYRRMLSIIHVLAKVAEEEKARAKNVPAG